MKLTVTNPYDGRDIGSVALADQAGLDRAIDRAAQAFEKSRRQAPFERSEILSRVAAGLKHRRDEFAATIVAEAGKPITLAEAEVDRAIITFTAAAEEARHTSGEWLDVDGFPSGKGHIGFVKRFPIGVIYGITPFNFPLNLVAHKVAPALASGNTILIKPSPRTPLSAIKLAELIAGSGAVEGQMAVVHVPNELVMQPIDDPRIRHVSFTGSAAVGSQVQRRAAGKRVTLELGGNAALVVHDDADLDSAVAAAANGAFGYAGQSCISVQRIFAQQAIYIRFREMLLAYIAAHIRCGDPSDRSVLVGPMIDSASIQRVLRAIEQATTAGAKVLTGGESRGPCLLPTVIEKAPLESDVCKTEIFAPVATLHPYEAFDEAISLANDSIYGLQAGVFTRDIARAWHAFDSLDVGGVMVNQAPTWRADTMPYGGVKQSGFGREGVRYAMQEMTEPKTLILRIT